MRLPANDDNEQSSADDDERVERNVDFSDYMWMGEEMEEFDSKCLMELYEEDFIESCFEELFEEEEQFAEEMENYLSQLTQDEVGCLVQQLDAVSFGDKNEVLWMGELNPDAPVFVPSSAGRSAAAGQEQTAAETEDSVHPK